MARGGIPPSLWSRKLSVWRAEGVYQGALKAARCRRRPTTSAPPTFCVDPTQPSPGSRMRFTPSLQSWQSRSKPECDFPYWIRTGLNQIDLFHSSLDDLLQSSSFPKPRKGIEAKEERPHVCARELRAGVELGIASGVGRREKEFKEEGRRRRWRVAPAGRRGSDGGTVVVAVVERGNSA